MLSACSRVPWFIFLIISQTSSVLFSSGSSASDLQLSLLMVAPLAKVSTRTSIVALMNSTFPKRNCKCISFVANLKKAVMAIINVVLTSFAL